MLISHCFLFYSFCSNFKAVDLGYLLYSRTIYLSLVDCKSVQKLTGSEFDGEYEMQVFGHDNQITPAFIYCNSMHTDNPKEFISLPAGPEKNFVKIQKDFCFYNEGIYRSSKNMKVY